MTLIKRKSRNVDARSKKTNLVVRYWRDHSLTIVLWSVGLLFLAAAFCFEPGQVFDFLLGLGHGAITVALFNTLAGPLRERNKPELK